MRHIMQAMRRARPLGFDPIDWALLLTASAIAAGLWIILYTILGWQWRHTMGVEIVYMMVGGVAFINARRVILDISRSTPTVDDPRSKTLRALHALMDFVIHPAFMLLKMFVTGIGLIWLFQWWVTEPSDFPLNVPFSTWSTAWFVTFCISALATMATALTRPRHLRGYSAERYLADWRATGGGTDA